MTAFRVEEVREPRIFRSAQGPLKFQLNMELSNVEEILQGKAREAHRDCKTSKCQPGSMEGHH
jgi:hypothetical protein